MNKNNEKILRFSIPVRTIYNFQGEGMYEETLEDHFKLIICEELLNENIDFSFNYHAFDIKDGFGTELKYIGKQIDLKKVILNLIKNKFRLGLIVQRLDRGNWIEIYNDSHRMKYKEFDIMVE
ncbi:hypothetical protein VOI54_10435 [Tamlana sp. 2201CG12-4]|uniref:hypothetical protein n=1 Tax=Tamlana sp. 2201CG12-4 TaxID=3112582 RepID=UPI002DBB5747|nr:hypothetical protein [Tamlana sp. 2201CG12-4]MEC3907437.1 hypothetical protein [Tamlana sp. 2201CG12-4]